METPFVDFRPAEYHEYKGKGYVQYYVRNPADNKMHRKQIRLNRIASKTERKRYAAHLCHTINDKLYSGWNPFRTAVNVKTMTITDGIALFLKEKGKASRDATMVSYRSLCNILSKWLTDNGYADTDVTDVNETLLTQYMDWVDAVRKPTNRTFNNYMVFLHTMFSFFIDRKLITESPVPNLGKRKVDSKKRVVIPKDVRRKIWDYYEKTCPPFCAVMLLCYMCLIRPKEIVGLKIGDINYSNQTLTVRANLAKNHRERTISVPDEIMRYFLTLVRCPVSWYIFTNKNKFMPGVKRMPHTRISDSWRVMRESLNLPDKYQFYSLKDTGITEMLEAGVPSKYVKELADHSSLEITEKYIHRSDWDAVRNCEMLDFR